MQIHLGTTSQDKKNIVDNVLKITLHESYQLVLCDVSSEITDQPLDAETTIRGSKNRAQNAMAMPGSDLSIGLEGGLVAEGGLYHLFCAVSMVDSRGNSYLGLSNKRPLPTVVSTEIKEGKQFGESIRKYMKNSQNTLSKQAMTEIEELISRRQSFIEALTACLSQYQKKL